MFDDDFLEEEGTEIVSRYEELKKSRSPIFFDVEEFGSIIDFYLRNNQIRHASEATDLASDLHPGSVEIQLKRAQLLITNGKNEDALDLLEEIRRKDPGNFEIYLNSGIAYLNLNQPSDARRCLKQSLATAEHSEDKADVWFTFAREYALRSYREDAETCFEKGVRLTGMVEDYFDFAEFCLEHDLYEEAIYALELMLEKDPFHVNGWLNLAGACIYVKREHDALNALDYVLAIRPDDSFAYYLRGLCYFNTDETENAKEAVMKSLSLDPDSIQSLKLMTDILWQSDASVEVVPYLEKYIERVPDDAEAFFMLSAVTAGGHDERCLLLQKAIGLDPANPAYTTALAYEYMNEKKYETAMEYAQRALQNDPEYDRAWVVLSVCEFYFRSPLDAWRVTLRFLRKVKGYPMHLMLLLSFYCSAMGRHTAAWRYYFFAVTVLRSHTDVPPVLTEYFDTSDFRKFIQNKKNSKQ